MEEIRRTFKSQSQSQYSKPMKNVQVFDWFKRTVTLLSPRLYIHHPHQHHNPHSRPRPRLPFILPHPTPEKMNLSDLGPEILVVHLIELLPHNTVLSLLLVDKALYDQLGHLRFRRTALCRSHLHRSITGFLRPSSLQTIWELSLNGLANHTTHVLQSDDFKSVRSVNLMNQLQASQKKAFSLFAHKQLTSLLEIANVGADTVEASTSSLCDLQAGCLSNLRVLHLQNVVLPPLQNLIANTNGIAPFLRAITFLPFRSHNSITSVSRYPEKYLQDAIVLLTMLSNRKLLPSLRTVEILLGRTDANRTMQKERSQLLKKIYTASAAHGDWRLIIKKPTVLLPILVRACIEGWSCWCSTNKGDIFITTEEINEFVEWCESKERYPRWDEFFDGNIHLDVNSNDEGVSELKTSGATRLRSVHGVSVLPGSDMKFPDALDAVTHATRCLSIQLKTFWGRLEAQSLDISKFTLIKYLRIQIADVNDREQGYRRPRNFSVNLSLSLVTILHLPKWSNLQALSIPAIALQWSPGASDTPRPNAASCGKHIPSYSLHWVAKCVRLQRFQITNWAACVRCYHKLKTDIDADPVEPDRSLVGGLMTCMPSGLTDFLISGVFTTSAPNLWELILIKDLQNALGRQVEIDFDQVRVEPA